MAETPDSDKLVKKEAEGPQPDPITRRSTSSILLISALLMMAVLAWALYDEAYTQRPWKRMQREFVARYERYLKSIRGRAGRNEKQIKESEEYQALDAEAKAAREKVDPRIKEIDKEVATVQSQLDAITDPYQNARGHITVIVYNAEVAGSPSRKQKYLQEVERRKQEPIKVQMPADGTGKTETQNFNYTSLEQKYNELRDKKAALLTEKGELLKEPTELAKKRDDYLKNQLTGLREDQVRGLIAKTEKFDYSMRQINVLEHDIVDRCETCHLGIREPVTLTPTNMRPPGRGRKPDELARAFVSHPSKELLTIHNPDRFGCSSCHWGNGRATTSTEKGHGRHKYWLHPMFEKENMEAGCQQCHSNDRVTQGADTLNLGRDLFQERGCVGCHRYEGFDRETDALSSSRQTIAQLEEQITNNERDARIATEQAGTAKSDTEAQQLQSRAQSLRVTNSQIAARIDQLNLQSRYLLQDQKKVGPNLKDVRLKLRKEWIPVWLHDPQAFRPGTKMPTFWRIDGKENSRQADNAREDEERKAIAAFLWQESFDARMPQQQGGNGANGKELFETKGCMACHSIGEGDQAVGGNFAANLTRVGDKANFEYIVHWIYNPRERFAPYCPKEKRDLSREDYEKKGLPYVFDADHSKCPNDGAELQIQNMTVMPNFRLTEQEARDIATYLFSLGKGANYPEASYMDDPKLKDQGRLLVKQYGCAGCHEIKGLEEEQRIGKELTTEGATPIERLDFAMLTRPAEYGSDPSGLYKEGKHWYNRKGFFDHKLYDPAVYDMGKEKEPKDRLRMPRPYLTEEWRNALVTFLQGSVGVEGANVPQSLFYNPSDRGRDIQEGWWVIKKYNCMGCHNIQVGQQSDLSKLPLYQNADWQPQLPPQLTSEGARVDPDWLLRFLRDPSLSDQGGAPEAARSDKTVGAQPQRANQPQFPTTNGNNQRGAQSGGGASAQPRSNQANSNQSASQGSGQGGGGANAQAGAGVQAGQSSNYRGPQLFRPQPGLDRNGIRPYLKARMPTFNFSPNELRILVRFFMAISSQEEPYIKEKLEPLSSQEQILARALFTSQGAPCLKCHITGDPEHDKTASAPNFLLASERLKPDWTFRWLLDPQQIAPGTAMPSELFKREGERWVFNGPTPEAFKDYHRDHARLLVRYMFLMTPQEQRALGTGSPPATSGQSPAPKETPPATTGQPVSRNNRAAPRRRNSLAVNNQGGARSRSPNKWRALLSAGAHAFRPARR